MRVGNRKIKTMIHPDSINTRIWEVYEVQLLTGQYAQEGDMAWIRITPGIEPFTSKKDAKDFLEALNQKDRDEANKADA